MRALDIKQLKSIKHNQDDLAQNDGEMGVSPWKGQLVMSLEIIKTVIGAPNLTRHPQSLRDFTVEKGSPHRINL